MANKEEAAMSFNGVQVFSETKFKEREQMGERITDWIRRNPKKKIVDKIVTQSSDNEFHCLAITLFYLEKVLDGIRSGATLPVTE